MNGNARDTAPGSTKMARAEMPDDDLPDLATPYWAERIERTEVRRGRPKADVTKVSTTIRLDSEVLEAFRSAGPGWQGRINAVLREAVGLA